MNAITAAQVTIANVDAPSEDGYDGTEGYIIEVEGQYHAESATLADAKAIAAELTGTDAAAWKQNQGIDRNGYITWSHS